MAKKQEDYVTDALEMIGIAQTKQIIQEVSGFVPVFEAILEKYDDSITALVFGRRWQYCQMKDGVCKASLETIANDLKISKATVMRHTDLLVKDGYLIDLTPDGRNVPHIYADAGKIIMKSQLTATVSQRNTRVSQRNTTVSESQLIKDSIKDSIKERGTPALDFKNMTVKEARQLPTIKLYIEATEQFPASVLWETLHNTITEKDLTFEQLHSAAVAWIGKGYRPENVTGILEWATNGIPTNGKTSQSEQKPAINDAQVDNTKQLIEEKWNFTPAPPPAIRPAIKALAEKRSVRR
jgi:hypothetical protein